MLTNVRRQFLVVRSIIKYKTHLQAYVGGIAGSVPNHRNKASHDFFSVSLCV
jgi:hypothetical protein